jgi:hypothetical protein
LIGGYVFGKVAVAIVSSGFCACALLAARQMRTQAAYELTQSRLRGVQLDNEVARARAQISAHVSPESVLQMAMKLDSMKSLVGEIGARPAPDSPRVAVNQPPAKERRR